VTAVADGDLKQNLTVQSKGEVAALAETINNMTGTLATFADQVTTVAREVGIPAENRFNAGVNFNDRRFLGSLSLNYSDKAFWVDVLDRTFAGYTDSYTMVNASFGVKWNEGRVVTSIKGTNITNESIQQHNFGDVLRRSLVGEVQVRF
jgi:hypothetical protein